VCSKSEEVLLLAIGCIQIDERRVVDGLAVERKSKRVLATVDLGLT